MIRAFQQDSPSRETQPICPECGSSNIRVDDEEDGGLVQCNACGEVIRVANTLMEQHDDFDEHGLIKKRTYTKKYTVTEAILKQRASQNNPFSQSSTSSQLKMNQPELEEEGEEENEDQPHEEERKNQVKYFSDNLLEHETILKAQVDALQSLEIQIELDVVLEEWENFKNTTLSARTTPLISIQQVTMLVGACIADDGFCTWDFLELCKLGRVPYHCYGYKYEVPNFIDIDRRRKRHYSAKPPQGMLYERRPFSFKLFSFRVCILLSRELNINSPLPLWRACWTVLFGWGGVEALDEEMNLHGVVAAAIASVVMLDDWQNLVERINWKTVKRGFFSPFAKQIHLNEMNDVDAITSPYQVQEEENVFEYLNVVSKNQLLARLEGSQTAKQDAFEALSSRQAPSPTKVRNVIPCNGRCLLELYFANPTRLKNHRLSVFDLHRAWVPSKKNDRLGKLIRLASMGENYAFPESGEQALYRLIHRICKRALNGAFGDGSHEKLGFNDFVSDTNYFVNSFTCKDVYVCHR